MTPPATLEWFGTATFRVRDAGLNLFFDAYLDRLPGLDPVGLSTREVGSADYVFISHSHFDHLYGADVLALGAGAASMPANSLRIVAARSWALTSRSPRHGTDVFGSLCANRHACSAGSTRTFVEGPQCTVSPPVTTRTCSSGTPA